MKTSNHLIFRFILAFMVCIYSAMQTVPALADDAPPASDSQPEEILSQLPEGTDVVVLSESGDNLPLATQAAADTLVEGDPIWCPSGVAPKGGMGGCSPVFDRFGSAGDDGGDADSNDADGSLIDWLTANQQKKAGTIWVEYNYDGAGQETADAINLSGATLTSMSAYALTIQGGWVGTNGSKALYTSDPFSYFNSTLSVSDWKGAVTINNIVFDGIHTNAADGTQTAIFVSTLGNIMLNNITVRDSYNDDDSQVSFTMAGATLSNLTGAGQVIINNSDFSGNESDGLRVFSRGMITANGLIASFNGGSGAILNNDIIQGKSVILKGLKQFNNNGSVGLLVQSAGAITISNLVANNNAAGGAILNNQASTGGLSVNLTGMNFSMNNGDSGLMIISHGAITISNLRASGNGDFGALLDNCDASGPDCNVVAARTVKLSGVNTFNDNETGLLIISFGAISISNLTASDNNSTGAILDNQTTNFYLAESKGTITLSGYNSFQNNGNDGLFVNSFGNIVGSNINAAGNIAFGINLTTTKLTGGSGITLNGINNFSNNGSNGAFLFALGTVTLNNITANGNGELGMFVVNQFDPAKSYNVSLKGTNTFNENEGDGLVVLSFGNIRVNNLNANENGQIDLAGSGATLVNCGCSTPKSITLTGYVRTSNNYDYGLNVNGGGAVTLINITAENNGNSGAFIRNDVNPLKGQTVTLNGSNTFNNNGGDGLQILSFGSIITNNITAFENAAAGAYLINVGAMKPGNVTLKGINNFVGNYMDGLAVETDGSATLLRINASGNDWDLFDDGYIGNGITVEATGNITLTCGFTVDHVNGSGYNLQSLGNISLRGIYSYNPAGLADVANGAVVSIITKPCTLP